MSTMTWLNGSRELLQAMLPGRACAVGTAMLILATMMLGACSNADEGDPTTTGSGTGSQPGGAGSIDVVVSLPFMTSMVDAVGGEHVQVESIVPVGADAHTYQPTPGDAQTISEAELIFVNGGGLEEFLDDLIESAGGVDAPVVELSEGLQDEAVETDGHEHGEDNEENAEGHNHGDETGNPHLWLNPAYGIQYVENVTAALTDIDPDNEGKYRENADGYIAEIEEFDEWAQEQIASIPEDNRVMVTLHDAFPYFAEHYGLEIVGVVITSPGREPGAQEVAHLAEEISESGAPAVFIEPQFNPDLAETIADEAGVTTNVLYSDSAPEGVGYLEMMRLNVESVVESLG